MQSFSIPLAVGQCTVCKQTITLALLLVCRASAMLFHAQQLGVGFEKAASRGVELIWACLPLPTKNVRQRLELSS